MARYVAIGAESTYGTAATRTEFLDVITESMKVNTTFEKIQSQRSKSVRKIVPLTSSVGGDVVAIGNYEDCGLLFKHFFGAVTTAGSGSQYSHTFPGSAGTAGRRGKSLTVEIERDDATSPDNTLTALYAGCKVTGFSMSVTREQSPQITWTLFGKSETLGGARTGYTAATFNPMLVTDLTVSFDAAALDLAEFSISCEWPVDEPHKIGSTLMHKEPQDNGPMVVEFECVRADYLNTTQSAKVGSTTPVDVSVTISDAQQSITFNLNNVMLTDSSNTMQSTETIQQRLTGEAAYDAATTESMQVILVNNDVTIP